MGTTGIGEGHEKTGTGATWQADGLRDTDVLSTATLTGFLERGLGNGVVPVTMTNYGSDASRNNPISGNACVRPNTGGASNSIFVDTGVVCLDGAFYNVGSASAFNFNTSSYYNARFNAGGMVLPSALNEECWVLVIVDPELTGTNNIGLVCGTVVNTSTGIYPQMPSSHLIKQSCILAAIRVTYGSPLVVASVEDKRVFIRGGPLPLTALFNSSSAGTDPLNDYGTSPTLTAGNLPITNLGLLYARDPGGSLPGAGQTHLYFADDQGTAHQITPLPRQDKQTIAYTGVGSGGALTYTPIAAPSTGGEHVISAVWFGSGSTKMCPLREVIHYTVSGKNIVFTDLATTVASPLGPLGIGEVVFTYMYG